MASTGQRASGRGPPPRLAQSLTVSRRIAGVSGGSSRTRRVERGQRERPFPADVLAPLASGDAAGARPGGHQRSARRSALRADRWRRRGGRPEAVSDRRDPLLPCWVRTVCQASSARMRHRRNIIPWPAPSSDRRPMCAAIVATTIVVMTSSPSLDSHCRPSRPEVPRAVDWGPSRKDLSCSATSYAV